VPGTRIIIKANATNTTSAPTIDISGQGARNIVDERGAALLAGNLVAGGLYEFIYDGSAFQLRSTVTTPPFSFSATAPVTVGTNVGFVSLLSTSAGSFVIPENFLKPGSAYRITVTGDKTSISGFADTQLRITSNGVPLATFINSSPGGAYDHQFTFTVTFVFRQIGAPSVIFFEFDEEYFQGTLGYETRRYRVINSVDFDSTIDNTIDVLYGQNGLAPLGESTAEIVTIQQLF
jgi:hypothetical protein